MYTLGLFPGGPSSAEVGARVPSEAPGRHQVDDIEADELPTTLNNASMRADAEGTEQWLRPR